MAEHALEMGHKIDLDVEVLRRGLRSTPQKLVAEALEIAKHPNRRHGTGKRVENCFGSVELARVARHHANRDSGLCSSGKPLDDEIIHRIKSLTGSRGLFFFSYAQTRRIKLTPDIDCLQRLVSVATTHVPTRPHARTGTYIKANRTQSRHRLERAQGAGRQPLHRSTDNHGVRVAV
ncbi:hypothetical protein T265_03900 [Opisthorchis viverrini]|uniref:Uncharacterized protein n=1 Tax=Opisthorchis viverrini TaxID=6198 RepID=A0A074ZPT4_OPIVI|nr:hypothetical protein T265_03900 [Opisthorchis viverrini]KER29433.1 hypothetical protein T265_03900 [Opisthorchis viverrini]